MITIRDAKDEDAEGIAKVLMEAYKIFSVEEGKRAFKIDLAKGKHYIVAEKGEKIIGLTTWAIHGLPKHGLAELDRIAILKESRKNGVATQLLERLKEEVDNEFKKYGKRLRKLCLMSHDNNNGAHEFYKKLGFKPEAKIENHYYEGQTEYIFSMYPPKEAA